MNKLFRSAALALAMCGMSLGACSAFGTALTTEQVYQFNNKPGDTIAVKHGLGTILENAQQGDDLDLTQTPLSFVREATGTLSQANIIAMNGAAVTLLAAPGAGKVIVIDEIEFFHDYATAVYSGGGDVTIEYATSGLDILVFDVALVTASADDNWLVKPSVSYTSSASTSSHGSLTTSANKAVTITNATEAFADGNASNVIKYRIRYHVVTLQT